MASLSKLNRREFLRVTGLASVGLALHATVNLSASSPAAAAGLKSSAGTGASLNVFVHIAANNRVTIMAHRSEMGQGVRTSLPQVVADELDADWDKVDILQAQGDEKYGDQNTDGSNSVRNFYQPMRELGASARLMLRQAAAAKWRVPLESCIAKDHRVTHTTSGRSLSYGELEARSNALARHLIRLGVGPDAVVAIAITAAHAAARARAPRPQEEPENWMPIVAPHRGADRP